jgi:prepilin-type N-terminal cleavage/methylation domain-containing protein
MNNKLPGSSPGKRNGFTLIELVIVVSIIAILATATVLVIKVPEIIENSKTAIAKSSMETIAKAAALRAIDTGDFDPDADHTLPEEFSQYLGTGSWPNGPFEGSVYDWDNWKEEECWDATTGNIQVTLRNIPNYGEKENYTLYYVIKGVGIPDCYDDSVRGECVNCINRYP